GGLCRAPGRRAPRPRDQLHRSRTGRRLPATLPGLLRRLHPGDLGPSPERWPARGLPTGEALGRRARHDRRAFRSHRPLAHRGAFPCHIGRHRARPPGAPGAAVPAGRGDVLSPEHVRTARAALPGTRLINGYGPTENTTFTCFHPVGAELDTTRSLPIGRPIANTRAHVLDVSLHPVPL